MATNDLQLCDCGYASNPSRTCCCKCGKPFAPLVGCVACAEALEAHAEDLDAQYKKAAEAATSLYHMANADVDAGFEAQDFRKAAAWLREMPHNAKVSSGDKPR